VIVLEELPLVPDPLPQATRVPPSVVTPAVVAAVLTKSRRLKRDEKSMMIGSFACQKNKPVQRAFIALHRTPNGINSVEVITSL
jgi:hypothetical protein